MSQVSRDLLKAAELLETHGHTKHRLIDVNGRMCVRGAIFMAITGSANPPISEKNLLRSYKAEDKLADLVFGDNPRPRFGVVDWNNDLHRKPEEVIDMLKAAARIA